MFLKKRGYVHWKYRLTRSNQYSLLIYFEKRVHVKKQPLHLLILDSGDMLQSLLQITKTKASFFCSSFVQDW